MFKRIILFPFSFLYFCITALRNFLFDQGLLAAKEYNLPVICVGNLKVGGTGKTPHVEYLIRLLAPNHNLAILSRGYGRNTKGYLEVVGSSEVDSVGDEPSQYKKKFGEAINVFVCEDRCSGIDTLTTQYPKTNVLVLDDAFQHRKVKAGFNILLTEYNKPFFRDSLLPGGWLRESRGGAGRADIVIVTKCPSSISENSQALFKKKIQQYAGDKPVFYTSYKYAELKPVYQSSEIEPKASNAVLALTGIANSSAFISYIKSKFSNVVSLNLKDHHQYKKEDESMITKQLNTLKSNNPIILTTEKDAVKIKDLGILQDYPIYYIPIEVVFLDKEDEFRSLIRNFVTKND